MCVDARLVQPCLELGLCPTFLRLLVSLALPPSHLISSPLLSSPLCCSPPLPLRHSTSFAALLHLCDDPWFQTVLFWQLWLAVFPLVPRCRQRSFLAACSLQPALLLITCLSPPFSLVISSLLQYQPPVLLVPHPSTPVPALQSPPRLARVDCALFRRPPLCACAQGCCQAWLLLSTPPACSPQISFRRALLFVYPNFHAGSLAIAFACSLLAGFCLSLTGAHSSGVFSPDCRPTYLPVHINSSAPPSC